jgi:[histone H3]-lysine79 N-trimethyltransferase
LTETSHFVDMGSGIGTMVSLMRIRTGCTSFGVEMTAQSASLAEKYVRQSMRRAQACGLKIGEMQLFQADMLKNELVQTSIGAADVVLVNNRMFSPASKCFLKDNFHPTNPTNGRCSTENFNREPPEQPQRWCKGVLLDAINAKNSYG